MKRWTPEEEKLLRELKANKELTWAEIAEQLSRTPGACRKKWEALQKPETLVVEKEAVELDISALVERFHGVLKLGLVSDTHFGSKYVVLEAVEKIPKLLVEAGASVLIHGGDWFDGSNVYKGQHFEQIEPGADGQLELAIQLWPTVGCPTISIGGNHDEACLTSVGLDNVKRLCDKRSDIHLLGYNQADLRLTEKTVLKILHPRGRLSRTRSRSAQNYIDAFVPNQPEILLLGHYHWGFLVMKEKGSWVCYLPCFQTETPYFRRQALVATIGGILLTIEFAKDGSIKTTDWRFFEYPRSD